MKSKIKDQNTNISESNNNKKSSIKNILKCLIYAVAIELYFVIFSIMNTSISVEIFHICIKASYILFIFISIIMFEIAYKKQKTSLIITGVEFIVLAIHILLISRNTDTQNILGTSSIWIIYYCLKAGIIQTKENQRKLKQISDISEIVKEEKPLKKVAKKRKK